MVYWPWLLVSFVIINPPKALMLNMQHFRQYCVVFKSTVSAGGIIRFNLKYITFFFPNILLFMWLWEVCKSFPCLSYHTNEMALWISLKESLWRKYERNILKSLAQCLSHRNCLKGLVFIHLYCWVVKTESVIDKANFLFLIYANQFSEGQTWLQL